MKAVTKRLNTFGLFYNVKIPMLKYHRKTICGYKVFNSSKFSVKNYELSIFTITCGMSGSLFVQ